MAYLSSFGPTTFAIEIKTENHSLCIELSSDANPPDGTYTIFIGNPKNGACGEDMMNVGTVTLDEGGTIQSVDFNQRFGGHNWVSMSGTFETDGSGSGDIADDSDPTGTSGVWAAGDSQPAGEREHKHGHHA
jgi:hypothetical protein